MAHEAIGQSPAGYGDDAAWLCGMKQREWRGGKEKRGSASHAIPDLTWTARGDTPNTQTR